MEPKCAEDRSGGSARRSVSVAAILGWASVQPAHAEECSTAEVSKVAVERYGGKALSVNSDGDYLIVRLRLSDGRVIDVAFDRWSSRGDCMRSASKLATKGLLGVTKGLLGAGTVTPLLGGAGVQLAQAGECSTGEASKIAVERYGGKALSVSSDGDYLIVRLRLSDGRVIDVAVDRWSC